MPATHVVAIPTDVRLYTVLKNGVEKHAQILQRRGGDVYVHYLDEDKRMDEWVPEVDCVPASREDSQEPHALAGPSSGSRTTSLSRKRKRGTSLIGGVSPALSPAPGIMDLDGQHEEIIMTEEDYDIQHHKQITAQRNFDLVNFGDWQIKTWYFSPYPLTETELEETPQQSSVLAGPKIPGVARATARSHGRTSDLLAGGLGRGEKAMLWVCEMCFKYMADGVSWETHTKKCTMMHPPGKKVYQRGAHIIWEVDGAVEKLYCQNLSLFGKLFIDVKTLFFDCDNFLFYILTDATSKKDHILGFFSKEKLSYDDYNLACIMTLPPYQRKAYGMLMIEFSYELSRRSGKVGTPERPLSDLGLRSYLAYWVATLVRFFRRVLSALPPESSKITTIGSFPDLRSPPRDFEENGVGTPGSGNMLINYNTNGNGHGNGANANGASKRKKRTKGWDGEADPSLGMADLSTMDDPIFTSQRIFDSIHRPDGGAETHVSVRCTLADIARATNLRVEDAAFALNESGLLNKRIKPEWANGNGHGVNGSGPNSGEGQVNGTGAGGTLGEYDPVVITRLRVEEVARERNVKIACMHMEHVLLPEKLPPS